MQKQPEARLAKQQSKIIDMSLRLSHLEDSREIKLLFIGHRRSNAAILADMLWNSKAVSKDECSEWKQQVKNLSVSSFRKIFDPLLDAEVSTLKVDENDIHQLNHMFSGDRKLDFDKFTAKALKRIWGSAQVQAFVQERRHQLGPSYPEL